MKTRNLFLATLLMITPFATEPLAYSANPEVPDRNFRDVLDGSTLVVEGDSIQIGLARPQKKLGAAGACWLSCRDESRCNRNYEDLPPGTRLRIMDTDNYRRDGEGVAFGRLVTPGGQEVWLECRGLEQGYSFFQGYSHIRLRTFLAAVSGSLSLDHLLNGEDSAAWQVAHSREKEMRIAVQKAAKLQQQTEQRVADLRSAPLYCQGICGVISDRVRERVNSGHAENGVFFKSSDSYEHRDVTLESNYAYVSETSRTASFANDPVNGTAELERSCADKRAKLFLKVDIDGRGLREGDASRYCRINPYYDSASTSGANRKDVAIDPAALRADPLIGASSAQ